jgi:hypothetical protein
MITTPRQFQDQIDYLVDALEHEQMSYVAAIRVNQFIIDARDALSEWYRAENSLERLKCTSAV